MDGCVLLGYIAAVSGACLFKFVKMPAWMSLPYTVTGSDLYGTLMYVSLILGVHFASVSLVCLTLFGQFLVGVISYRLSYQHFEKYTVWFAIPSAVVPMLVTTLITALTSTTVTTVAAAASTTT